MNAEYKVSFVRSNRARYLRITIKPDSTVSVTLPPGTTIEQGKDLVRSKQSWIDKQLTKIQQRQNNRPKLPRLSRQELMAAQEYLFARLDHFAQKHKLYYRKATFRCQKTRWGSCSTNNNISLNIHLAYLPPHLQDYVLLHELCHIRHKHHQKPFWNQLDKMLGRPAKQLARELKKYSLENPLQID